MLCFSLLHRAENERECGAAGEFRPLIGSEGAADLPEREIRPRMEPEGAADRLEREFPAAPTQPLRLPLQAIHQSVAEAMMITNRSSVLS